MKKIIVFLLCLFVGFTVIAKGESEAQEGDLGFPKKPITIIVPVDAGGGSDTLARAISAISDQYFKQPIIVVNRGGAGGTIGATEFLNNKPDGYTLLLAHAAIFTTQPKMQNVSYTIDSFTGVIGLNDQPIVLAALIDSPYKKFNDIVNSGKRLKMSANAVGSIFFVGAKDLMDKAGIDVIHVPFNGNSPALAALLSKNVDFGFFHPEEVISHVEAGTMRVLGTMTEKRIASFPDVPTFKELGYDVEYGVWKALLAPAGTDPAIIGYLHDSFLRLFDDPAFIDYTKKTETNMVPINGKEVDKKLKSEVDSYSDIITRLQLVSK